jgi:MFS family permease
MVALIQAATNLPFFLLALPAGALADIVDRRRLLLFAQGWMLVAAVALAVLTFAGYMTPWLLGADLIVTAGVLTLATMTLAVAWLPYYPLWCVFLLLAGGAWLAALTRLNASAQAAVPRWVRARALAVYLLIFFGGMAAGSALWGYMAVRTGVPLTLTASAALMGVGSLMAFQYRLPEREGAELEPSRHWPEMAMTPTVCGEYAV